MTRTRIASDGLADQSVTFAKVQNVAADRLLGRSSSTAGVCQEIVCTASGRALIGAASAADQRTTLGLGSITDVGGDVGIGTATPFGRLHLYNFSSDCIAFVQGRAIAAGGSGRSVVQLDVDGTGGYGLITDSTSGTRLFRLVSNNGYDSGTVDCLAITSVGQVGIGTGTTGINPIYKLDVRGGRSIFTANNEPYVIGARHGIAWGSVWYGATAAALPDAVISNAGGLELVRFTNTGFCGIGTTAPATHLHVSDATRPDLRLSGAGPSLDMFTNTVAAYLGTVTAHPLAVRTNNVDRLVIDANGNATSTIQGGTTLLPQFQCRAWVNFNGTADTTGASSTANTGRLIRASGNVTSVTRTNTGVYQINFANAMPDADYCVTGGYGTGVQGSIITTVRIGPATTSNVIVITIVGSAGTPSGVSTDAVFGYVAIFR